MHNKTQNSINFKFLFWKLVFSELVYSYMADMCACVCNIQYIVSMIGQFSDIDTMLLEWKHEESLRFESRSVFVVWTAVVCSVYLNFLRCFMLCGNCSCLMQAAIQRYWYIEVLWIFCVLLYTNCYTEGICSMISSYLCLCSGMMMHFTYTPLLYIQFDIRIETNNINITIDRSTCGAIIWKYFKMLSSYVTTAPSI